MECGLDSTRLQCLSINWTWVDPIDSTLLQLPSIDWIDFGSICFCRCLFFRYDMCSLCYAVVNIEQFLCVWLQVIEWTCLRSVLQLAAGTILAIVPSHSIGNCHLCLTDLLCLTRNKLTAWRLYIHTYIYLNHATWPIQKHTHKKTDREDRQTDRTGG